MKSVTLRLNRGYGAAYKVVSITGSSVAFETVDPKWIASWAEDGGTVTILGDEQKPGEIERLKAELAEMRGFRDTLESKLIFAHKAATGAVPLIGSNDPRWSIVLDDVWKIQRERNKIRDERDELQAKVHDLRNHLKNADAEILAYSLAERGNSAGKRAFNELELAFNRMREFLYPETVGENGQ
jgi:hypothetical protein